MHYFVVVSAAIFFCLGNVFAIDGINYGNGTQNVTIPVNDTQQEVDSAVKVTVLNNSTKEATNLTESLLNDETENCWEANMRLSIAMIILSGFFAIGLSVYLRRSGHCRFRGSYENTELKGLANAAPQY
ncbi:uncharacterized protein LOC143459226 [Clavelina lepadiformis]|uniref:Uncharacterized protein n=1 Tax=Clavelina lepadiformis TaxID=159417 RepID=A0ABP0GY93_CLALP